MQRRESSWRAISPIRSSCSGWRNEKSRQTAIDSPPQRRAQRSQRGANRRLVERVDHAFRSAAFDRSRSEARAARSVLGGRRRVGRGPARFCRPSSSMSVNPRVAKQRRLRESVASSIAFVVTVIPCTKSSTSRGSTAASGQCIARRVEHADRLILGGRRCLAREQPVRRS